MSGESEKTVAQERRTLPRFFPRRQQRLKLLVLFERERISAQDSQRLAFGQTASSVGHRQTEKTGVTFSHRPDRDDAPRAVDSRQQVFGATPTNLDLDVVMPQHRGQHRTGGNWHRPWLSRRMINHLSQLERWNRRRQAIQRWIRKQPLRCQCSHLLAPPTGSAELIVQLCDSLGVRLRARQQCTTGSSSCTLAAAETQDRNISESAERSFSKSSAGSLRRVLDHRNTVPRRHRLHRRDIGGISVKVRYNYSIHH